MQLRAASSLIWFCANAATMLVPAYICDAVRTPFARCGGALAALRADELAALPLAALMVRHAALDWEQVDDVILGCAAQTGEADGNVARIASLLAGLPESTAASTINRLCGSGLEAVGAAARAIRCGEAVLAIAGGVESASRMPVLSAASSGHFGSKSLRAQYPDVSVEKAARRLGAECGINAAAEARVVQASLEKARRARDVGWSEAELSPVTLAQDSAAPAILTQDELAQDSLSRDVSQSQSELASPADGACALLLANEKLAHKFSLPPKARVLGSAAAGVPPDMAGLGAAGASRKLLVQLGIAMDQIDVIELHESPATAVVAALRDWGLQDDDLRVNPCGGALALGDPRGASGARMVTSAMYTLHREKLRYALCAMSIGCGQGVATVIERV